MKRILFILFVFCFVQSYGQSVTGTKTRFPGIWWSSKDTANATSADSIVVLASRGDQSLYWRWANSGPWSKITTHIGSGYITNQIGSNLVSQSAKFRISDTAWARMFRGDKFYGDSLQATGSGGGNILSNGGSLVAQWGAGGGTNFDFHGFAGYNANRSSSYTVRSFTDKNYVDSADALRLKISDTSSMLTNYLKKDFAGVTGTLPVANGGTGANSFTANRFLLGNGTSAITTNASINYDGTYVNLPAVSAGGGFLTGGSSGGSGILFYNSNSSLVLRSAFDTLRLQGGQNNANKRPIAFYTGDASGYSAMFDENGLFMRGSAQSLSTNTNEYATTAFVKGQGYTSNTGTVTSVGVSGANGIGVSGSPITNSGTFSLSLGNITPTTISTGSGTFTGGVFLSGGTPNLYLGSGLGTSPLVPTIYHYSAGGSWVFSTFVDDGNGEHAIVDGTSGVRRSVVSQSGVTTLNGTGTPLVVNSTNSTTNKIAFQDNTTIRGYAGANSTNAFEVANSSGTGIFAINNSTSTAVASGFQSLANGIPLLSNSLNSNTYKIQFQDNGTARAFLGANSTNALEVANGSVTQVATINATTGAYTATSDSSAKKNITDAKPALDSILKIKVRAYDWKTSGVHEPWGVIAQELYSVTPTYVSKPVDSTGRWGVLKAEMVPMLIKSIQELKAENDNKQLQIDNLRYQLDEIKALLLKNNIK